MQKETTMNAEKSTNCRTSQNRADLRMRDAQRKARYYATDGEVRQSEYWTRRAAYFASVIAKKAEVLA